MPATPKGLNPVCVIGWAGETPIVWGSVVVAVPVAVGVAPAVAGAPVNGALPGALESGAPVEGAPEVGGPDEGGADVGAPGAVGVDVGWPLALRSDSNRAPPEKVAKPTNSATRREIFISENQTKQKGFWVYPFQAARAPAPIPVTSRT